MLPLVLSIRMRKQRHIATFMALLKSCPSRNGSNRPIAESSSSRKLWRKIQSGQTFPKVACGLDAGDSGMGDETLSRAPFLLKSAVALPSLFR